MKVFKPLLIWANILAQIAIFFSGLAILGYSWFTQTPLRGLIDFDWWIGFFVFYMWSDRVLTPGKQRQEETQLTFTNNNI